MKRYKAEVRVIYADTDKMGIAYHANYLKWFEIGRSEFLRAMGFPYSEIERRGVWFPVSNVSCEYKSSAVYDDMLSIETWVKELGGASMILGYEIFNKETGTLLAKGQTKHPVTDHNLKPVRLKKVLPELWEKMEEYCDGT